MSEQVMTRDQVTREHSAAPAQTARSTQANRISGGFVDRARTLRFTWNGKQLEGHPGDTLASALIANGVRLVGRSFKYRRVLPL